MLRKRWMLTTILQPIHTRRQSCHDSLYPESARLHREEFGNSNYLPDKSSTIRFYINSCGPIYMSSVRTPSPNSETKSPNEIPPPSCRLLQACHSSPSSQSEQSRSALQLYLALCSESDDSTCGYTCPAYLRRADATQHPCGEEEILIGESRA